MSKYGTELETFAKIRAKASRHAANNPLALFRKVVTPRRRDECPHDLARCDDALDGLPTDLWCRSSGAGIGSFCQGTRAGPARIHRRAKL